MRSSWRGLRFSLAVSLLIPAAFLTLGASSEVQQKPVLPANALPVPIVRQATVYSCGAAALQSILYYWKVYDGPENWLWPIIGTTEEHGTSPMGIVKGAKEYGLDAHWRENVTIEDLRKAVKKGETVIIDVQAWSEAEDVDWKNEWEAGHYLVVVALDDTNVYVMDPSTYTGYAYIPLSELIDRWHDYEIVDGKIWRNYQLAIFIKGDKAVRSFPAAPAYVE